MSYTPVHLQPYSRPSNYFGETWEGWYPVASIHRDSDVLSRSNYRVISRLLSDLPAFYVEEEEGEGGFLQDHCSHWAVGWLDTLYVHSTHEEALRLADELVGSLVDYPILDEEDFCELEHEEAQSTWESFSLRDRIELCAKYDVSIFAARHECMPYDDTGEMVSYLAS